MTAAAIRASWFVGADGFVTSSLTVTATDLPCTDADGTVINSFSVRADVFLLGQPVESVFTISVNLP